MIQRPSRRFWIAIPRPGSDGRTVPEKCTRPPRRTLVLVTRVPTTARAPTGSTGLTMPARSVTRARNCVVTGSESTAIENRPRASVTRALPTLAKPPANGNARCWIWTGRPAAPVPVTVPTRVVGPPNDVGFGVAASATRSACAGVRNVRSAVTEVPVAFVATRRK